MCCQVFAGTNWFLAVRVDNDMGQFKTANAATTNKDGLPNKVFSLLQKTSSRSYGMNAAWTFGTIAKGLETPNPCTVGLLWLR